MPLDRLFAALALVCAVCAGIYNVLTVIAAARFRARRTGGKIVQQPATIIIPLKGDSGTLEEELRRFCLQDYPEYQIVFALESEADPAMAAVRRVIAAFPKRDLAVAHWSGAVLANPKENSHAAALRLAKHELIVLADGDVLAGPDYLAKVLEPLADPRVGLASFPYRFIGASSFLQRLKGLTIHAGFLPSVLVAWLLAPVRFGIGATMAVRRKALEAIGGFEAVGDFLASDFYLAHKISAAGWRVELGRHFLDIRLEPLDWRTFRRWQLRWTRTMRFTEPAGYAGLVVTQGLSWAVIYLALTRGALGWLVLALTLAIRWLCLWLVWGQAGVHDSLLLAPVYDLAASAFWATGWLGREVYWGGRPFLLESGTKIRTR